MTFGELLKELRLAANMSLRDLSRKACEDAANLSRIERSLRPAPNEDVVIRYAKALGLTPDSEMWSKFMDAASISRRELPKDLTEEELQEKVPAFLRTIRGERPSKEVYEKISEITRSAFRCK